MNKPKYESPRAERVQYISEQELMSLFAWWGSTYDPGELG